MNSFEYHTKLRFQKHSIPHNHRTLQVIPSKLSQILKAVRLSHTFKIRYWDEKETKYLMIEYGQCWQQCDFVSIIYRNKKLFNSPRIPIK